MRKKGITGVLAFLVAAAVLRPGVLVAQETSAEPGAYRSFSPFPILMYDSDIGFGYGGRVKFVDYFKKKESLDLILFNSTKGERWYVFSFSIPDLERRQGKRYGLSFDLKAEYDKFLNYSFYGIGAGTPAASFWSTPSTGSRSSGASGETFFATRGPSGPRSAASTSGRSHSTPERASGSTCRTSLSASMTPGAKKGWASISTSATFSDRLQGTWKKRL